MTRLLCFLFRHSLVPVRVQTVSPVTLRAAIVQGERCRCGKVVEVERVYEGPQFPARRA